jgi:sarcosine oxidase subunit beta
MEKTADAVVIGGGILGASTAHFLAKKKFGKVVLVEKTKLAAVSTGHSAAIVRTFYSNPLTMELALRSRSWFENAEEALGGDCDFRQVGYCCLFGEKLAKTGEQILQIPRPEGAVANKISPDRIRELAPLIDVDDIVFGIHEPLSGYVNPTKTTENLVSRAKDWGLSAHEGVAATRIRLTGHQVSAVETDQGTIETPVAVNAAGGWARAIGLTIGLNYSLRWSREADLVVKRPAGYADFPVIADPNLQVYIRPEGDGSVLSGLGPPKEVEPLDIDNYDPGLDARSRRRIEAGLFRRMPALKEQELVEGWGSMYAITDDWHPLVGPEPGLDGYYACFGGSGHGFKLGPPIGDSLSDMIAGVEPKIDIHAFRPNRFIEGEMFTSAWGGGNRA